MAFSFGAGVRDSLSNLAASLGTGRDKASHDAFTVFELGRAQIEAMYRGDWLARKVVDIVPYDSVRAWRSWSGHRADVARFEAAERRLGLRKTVQRAMTLGRLYGGGAVLIGDGEDDIAKLARPLDPRLPRGGLLYLHAVSRWQLGAAELELNPLSPWVGEPKMYTLSSPGQPRLELHPSRVVRFLGNPLPDPGQVGAFWSDSVLQVLYDAVHAAALSLAGATSLLHEAKVDVVTVPNLSEHLSSVETTEQLSARFAYAAAMKSMNNLLLLGDGESWSRQSVDFAGLPEMARTFLQVAAGAADIPVTRLLGQSPAGLSATGESDVRNYYDMIAARQELDLRPQLERLDRLICWSEGIDERALSFAFRPLWQLDEPAKAALALSRAQATQVYAGLKLWPDAVMARLAEAQLIQDKTYPNAAAVFAEAGTTDPTGSSPTLDFDPAQPRAPDGRWTTGPGSPTVPLAPGTTSGDPASGASPVGEPAPATARPDRLADVPHGWSEAVAAVASMLDPVGTASAHEAVAPAEALQRACAVPPPEPDPAAEFLVRTLGPLYAALQLRQSVIQAVKGFLGHAPEWFSGGSQPDAAPPTEAAKGGQPERPADPSPPPLTIHGEAGSAALPGFSPAPPLPELPPATASPEASQPNQPSAPEPSPDDSYSFSKKAKGPQQNSIPDMPGILSPGPNAKSPPIPAGPTPKPDTKQQKCVDENGDRDGCHGCPNKSPGTITGH